MPSPGLAPAGAANAQFGRRTDLRDLFAAFSSRFLDGWRLLAPERRQSISVDRTIELSSDATTASDYDAVQSGERIELLIGDDLSIDDRIELPFAPRADIEALIALRVESDAPFPAGETRFVSRISAPRQEKVMVDIALFERARIEAAIEAIEARGANVITVGRKRADGGSWSVAPAWRQVEEKRPNWAALPAMVRSAILGLVIAAGSLAAAVIYTEMRVETLRPSASAALDGLAAQAKRDAQLMELRNRQGVSANLLSALDQLSEKLADGTWLEQVTLEGGKLTLLTYAPSSTGTLDLVSTLPGIRNAVIEGSIARDASAGLERFRIVAEFSAQAPVGLRP
jgi:general secretion pathway protein L